MGRRLARAGGWHGVEDDTGNRLSEWDGFACRYAPFALRRALPGFCRDPFSAWAKNSIAFPLRPPDNSETPG
jgi:hypothetical protein